SLHAADVSHDHSREFSALFLIDVGHLQNLSRTQTRANAISKLMCQRTIECTQPLFALRDAVGNQLQKLRRRRLLDQAHCMVHALCTGHQLAVGAPYFAAAGHLADERQQDAAEDLELLENLVLIEALCVTEAAKLPRLVHNRHVGGHDGCGIGYVRRYSVDQNGDVIQEVGGWKYPIRIDRYARRDAIEPARRKLVARLTETQCKNLCERTVFSQSHVSTVTVFVASRKLTAQSSRPPTNIHQNRESGPPTLAEQLHDVRPCGAVGGCDVVDRLGGEPGQGGKRGFNRSRNVRKADGTSQEEANGLLVCAVEYCGRHSATASRLNAQCERWKPSDIDRLECERRCRRRIEPARRRVGNTAWMR